MATLNLLLKISAIEGCRFSRLIKSLAFHPGTTDTPLTEPLNLDWSKNRVFKPAFVAERLLALTEDLPKEPAINFLDWDGKAVKW